MNLIQGVGFRFLVTGKLLIRKIMFNILKITYKRSNSSVSFQTTAIRKLMLFDKLLIRLL
jgi:hypothetical protein